MPRFLVLVSERHGVTYLVEGESVEHIEEEWDMREVDQAVIVNDNFLANEIVSVVEAADWSPMEKAWVKQAAQSTASLS